MTVEADYWVDGKHWGGLHTGGVRKGRWKNGAIPLWACSKREKHEKWGQRQVWQLLKSREHDQPRSEIQMKVFLILKIWIKSISSVKWVSSFLNPLARRAPLQNTDGFSKLQMLMMTNLVVDMIQYLILMVMILIILVMIWLIFGTHLMMLVRVTKVVAMKG